MDAVLNPFAPGSGHKPPFLAGREETIRDLRTALSRVAAGRAEKNYILAGLRGVGKTVLLMTSQDMATQAGLQTTMFEAGNGQSLRGLLASRLRQVFLRLDLSERLSDHAKRALSVVASFASAVKLSIVELHRNLDSTTRFATTPPEVETPTASRYRVPSHRIELGAGSRRVPRHGTHAESAVKAQLFSNRKGLGHAQSSHTAQPSPDIRRCD